MSVLVSVPGVPQKPDSLLLSTTGVLDVKSFAAGADGLVYVTSIIIANASASARDVSVWWTENTTDSLIYIATVAAKTTVTNALDAPLFFNAKATARKIRAQASNANDVTVTVVHTLVGQKASGA